MNVEEMMFYLIPILAFAATATCAFFLGKNRSRTGTIALAAVWALFTGAMFIGMEQASGFDGLGYFAALLGISAPVAAGLVIGAPIGWLKKPQTGT